MEATIKVGSKFSENGTVVAIRNNGVIVSFQDRETFVTFSDCEMLFGV